MSDLEKRLLVPGPAWSRRRFLKAMAMSAGMVGLSACTPQSPAPPSGGAAATAAPAAKKAAKDSLTVALYSEPSTLSAVTEWADPPATQCIYNIFNGLCSLNTKTRKIEPELATAWTLKDPTTWSFKLREGVMFHKDFGEFTAEDVEFNVNITVEKNKPRKFLYFFVKGAKAIDKYNVEIYMEKPFAPFLVTMPHGVAGFMASKKAYDQLGEEAFNRNPVGTGPFLVESWKSGSEIVLRKNTKYWKPGLPKLEKVTFRPIADIVVKGNMLRTGEIDFMDNPDFKDIAAMRQNPDLVVSSIVSWNWDYITFNTMDPNSPLSKKEVRQAIGFALDRDALMKNVYYGEGAPDDDPLPPVFLGSDPDQVFYPDTPDLSKAKELMAKAGYPNGFSITCITSDKATLRRELELVAAQLSKIGIQLQLQVLDLGTYNTRNREDKFEMALEDITIMTPDSDSSLYWFIHSGSNGDHGYVSKTMDDLLDGARVEQDETKRAQMYRQIISLLQEDAPYLYTGHSNFVRVYRKGIQGYEPSPMDIDFQLEKVYWES